eukprot:7060850-Pyramimonas_sp.AAC.1
MMAVSRRLLGTQPWANSGSWVICTGSRLVAMKALPKGHKTCMTLFQLVATPIDKLQTAGG